MTARWSWPLTVTVIFWAFNFTSLKILYEEVTPPAVALVRYAVMFLALLGICAWTKQSLAIDRADMPRLLFAGMLSMGVYMVFFLNGMEQSTPAEGAILLSTAPLITYVLSVILGHEKFLWGAMLGTLIAFGGVALVVIGGSSAAGHGTLMGNVFVLISALIWAVSTLLMRPILAKYAPMPAFTVSLLGALPVLIPYGLLATLKTPYMTLSPIIWLNLGQVSFLSGVAAFVCFYKGMQEVGAAVATRYQFFVPVLATFFGWAITRQPPAMLQWFGMAVTLAGVAISLLVRSSSSPQVPADN